MRHRMLGVLPVVGLAVSAAAQPFTSDSSVTFSLRWSEHGGNQNGLLEPGESAFLSLDVSFTNQNQIAQFAPHVGTFGSGTIRGFGAGFLDYHGTATNGGNARGAWNVDEAMGYGVSVNWGTGLIESGIPVNGGADLINIQFGQFAASPSAIMTMNPVVAIWTGLWTPESYTPRTVTFTPAGAAISGWAAGIVLRLSTSAVATVFVTLDHCIFDGVSIPIVPTPPSLAGIVLAFLLRRRRPGSLP